MAWTEQFTCDVCGVVKKSVNHWYMVSVGKPDHHEGFLVIRWSKDFEKDKEIKHACGQEHLHKLLDEFLQKAQSQ